MKDQSFTCLGGNRIRKSAKILELLGDLDELMAILGMARAFAGDKNLNTKILEIQNELIEIGGWLSGTIRKLPFKEKTDVLKSQIKDREDFYLQEFVRPGSSQPAAFLHLARAIARRLERQAVRLKSVKYKPLIGYLNHLSGFIFWLAVQQEKAK